MIFFDTSKLICESLCVITYNPGPSQEIWHHSCLPGRLGDQWYLLSQRISPSSFSRNLNNDHTTLNYPRLPVGGTQKKPKSKSITRSLFCYFYTKLTYTLSINVILKVKNSHHEKPKIYQKINKNSILLIHSAKVHRVHFHFWTSPTFKELNSWNNFIFHPIKTVLLLR